MARSISSKSRQTVLFCLHRNGGWMLHNHINRQCGLNGAETSKICSEFEQREFVESRPSAELFKEGEVVDVGFQKSSKNAYRITENGIKKAEKIRKQVEDEPDFLG